MAKPHILYEKPIALLNLDMLPLGQLRAELANRIHNLENRRSTDAFTDLGLCYFDPGLILEVAVHLLPHLDHGSHLEFTKQRRRVIESVVSKLKDADAVVVELLTSTSHYCGKFRICLGRGCKDPEYLDRWLIPVRPDFFWGAEFPDISEADEVISRRRLTGLAALRWVTPLTQKGRAI